MLIRESDQRDNEIDTRLASFFAGVAGALNAAGFQATGFFSANMTGNVSALSDHLGLGQIAIAAFLGCLVAMFIGGAFVSGLLIEAGRKRQVRTIYAYSIAFEGFLLLTLGCADILVETFERSSLLVLGLSFILGIQNAATTRISDARVRTTHVSGMATDIGLGLAALLGVGAGAERQNALARLKLYTRTITAFLVGGVLGIGIYLLVDGYIWILAAAVLLAIALPEIKRGRAL